MKLHILAVQGYIHDLPVFHTDFYFAETVGEAVDQATAAFLKKYPESRGIATSSYALEDGVTLQASNGKFYTLRIEEK